MGNMAFFQLGDRLARQKITHPDDAQAQDDVVDELHSASTVTEKN